MAPDIGGPGAVDRSLRAPGIWFVVHKDNRDTPRIRAVMNHVTESMKDMRGILMPEKATEA